ncbi:MAG TPA: glycosyltransferase family 2 protein [Gemmatimonadaceae bacterium]|nr:glycosyltransferase family 2 protein [Gemmatimonadaceae bacterium]
MLKELAVGVALAPVVTGAYAYVGYPALLSILARRSRGAAPGAATELPTLSVVIPVYNEERVIADTLEHVLSLDYPRDRLQVLVVSDASTDGTDEIARSFAGRGVELLRVSPRRGKTAAENAAGAAVRGDIVVNVDATIRLPRHALRAIVQPFADPTVGVASGRDVTVGNAAAQVNRGEGTYTGYEMRVRALETRLHSIVGASGCFFATRHALYRLPFPEHLSRDFGSALVARAHGFRAVSVEDAVCFVPCTTSLHVERRRKVRTMTRGLGTLWYMRRLLNPARYGVFAWMLFSHKLARWTVTLSAPFALGAVGVLAVLPNAGWAGLAARWIGAGAIALMLAGWAGFAASAHRPVPRLVAMPAFVVASVAAGVQAWFQWLSGREKPLWEPTRRTQIRSA